MSTIIHLHPFYSSTNRKHLFWHAAYKGLAANPESWQKYGIKNDDYIPFMVVKVSLQEMFDENDIISSRSTGISTYGFDEADVRHKKIFFQSLNTESRSNMEMIHGGAELSEKKF